MSWAEVYASDWQAVWALWIAPLVFLGFRARRGPPERGAIAAALAPVDTYCIAFAVATLVDPLFTTLLVREWGGGSSTVFATLVGLFFVLLGDFRVFLLAFGLSRNPASLISKAALLRAALFTAVVPAGAYALFFGGKSLAASELDPRWLWFMHESLFIALALGLRQLWLPRRAELSAPGRRFLSAILVYSAAYYALWASADLIILAGFDAGYALRILPNQLYYAFWIPFVWWRFGKSAAPSDA